MSEDKINRIESFINDYWKEHLTSPTVREIEAGVGIPRTTVGRYLEYMRDNGILDYSGRRNITTDKMKKTDYKSSTSPIVGEIACGTPMLAEENIEGYVETPAALYGKGDYFILHAKGDSMTGVGIDDGDLVLIQKQNTAEPGQVIVALINDEATLKRYYPEPKKRKIRLHPENEKYDDFYVDNCIIQGVARFVIRKEIK